MSVTLGTFHVVTNDVQIRDRGTYATSLWFSSFPIWTRDIDFNPAGVWHVANPSATWVKGEFRYKWEMLASIDTIIVHTQ